MRLMALCSAYNKDSISRIAQALVDEGYELLATGKTRVELETSGFKVVDITELTGEPERFGGRVKTLHHKVMGGLLFRPDQDEKEWPYDFRIGAVVCNFYPFKEKARECRSLEELSEWIDIGGPSMVRAAAKNFNHVWVFTSPGQYARFIGERHRNIELRAQFALEAFEAVEELDELVSFYHHFFQHGSGGGELSYGENPHQRAFFLPNRRFEFKVYGTLSYNNVRDAEAALRFVLPFSTPAISVVKHQTLCGAAVGLQNCDPDRVFNWAWEGDPVSRYGGILAFNFIPSVAVTKLLQKKFVELIVLPKSPEAESWAVNFQKCQTRIKIILVEKSHFGERFFVSEKHSGVLGKLVQDPDFVEVEGCETDREKLEKAFGTWASANSKSNAMVLAGFDEKCSVAYMAGCGQGQPNRIDALRLLAIPRARDFCARLQVEFESLVAFSDAFLPFDDCIRAMSEVGLRKVFQPGGSKKDSEVIETAKALGIEMQMTGKRHFWH